MARIITLLLVLTAVAGAQDFASHPPLRPLPVANDRPLAEQGAHHFVHPSQGNDDADGSREHPWRTINHALSRLAPGDTLVLRGGVYFENVYCAVAGLPDQPITIRSAPDELAIVDGGIPVFQTDPASAWQPAPDGGDGEYISTAAYNNIRDVIGRFGDSMVGLQTYWYRMDLQSDNELWINDPATMVKPVYCGPGVWYDKQTGRIHARLAHTNLQLPDSENHELPRYTGETDPRKLPLVIAPFASSPLVVDQAMHVRFEDIVFRGGGYRTVRLTFGVDVTFDRCTVFAGGYGIWAKNTGPLKMTHCGVFGMIPPWAFRTENVSYAYSASVYPPFVGEGEAIEQERAGDERQRPQLIRRHIARLPTHAVLVTEGGYEFETFYYPLNHDWDIAHCEFTDGHDGVYLSGRDIYFHHNLVDNMQDDAVYVSSPTPYVTDNLHVYQNLLRTNVGAIGAHARGGPGGNIFVYRNVIDQRRGVQFGRPTPDRPQGRIKRGSQAWLVHNPDHIIHMEDISFYHNTCIVPMNHIAAGYTSGMIFGMHPESKRRVYNNLFAFPPGKRARRYPNPLGHLQRMQDYDLAFAGNLFWIADPAVEVPDAETYFAKIRALPLSEKLQADGEPGLAFQSIIGDPKFEAFDVSPHAQSRFGLTPNSPAVNAGVAVPDEWLDPLRDQDEGAPDIGALPLGARPLKVGIDGRTTAGDVMP